MDEVNFYRHQLGHEKELNQQRKFPYKAGNAQRSRLLIMSRLYFKYSLVKCQALNLKGEQNKDRQCGNVDIKN